MTRISHFKLGLFFLLSVAVMAGGLFWLGSTGYFRETKTYVTYFDSSVQGLDPQSDVKYLGMSVGKVKSLELAPRDQNLVRVLLSLEADFELENEMAVRRSIKGITGQAYLAIIKAPENIQQMTPKLDFPIQHPRIPSIPGRIERVSSSLAELYRKVEALDAKGLVEAWKGLAKSASGTFDELRGGEILRNIRLASQDVRSVSQRLEEITGPLAEPGFARSLNKTLSDLAEASRSARRIAGSLQEQVERLQPDAAAEIAASLNSTLKGAKASIQSVDQRFGESMVRLEQSLIRLNQALSEVQALARSLRIDPGRILNRTQSNEPFQK